jgi:hypothetical protein
MIEWLMFLLIFSVIFGFAGVVKVLKSIDKTLENSHKLALDMHSESQERTKPAA